MYLFAKGYSIAIGKTAKLRRAEVSGIQNKTGRPKRQCVAVKPIASLSVRSPDANGRVLVLSTSGSIFLSKISLIPQPADLRLKAPHKYRKYFWNAIRESGLGDAKATPQAHGKNNSKVPIWLWYLPRFAKCLSLVVSNLTMMGVSVISALCLGVRRGVKCLYKRGL